MERITTCPNCRGDEFIVVPEIQDGNMQAIALAWTAGWSKSTPLGALEAYVCAVCGRVEVYTRDVKDLGSIPGARRVKGVPRPPYR
jgi:hypothetical protein